MFHPRKSPVMQGFPPPKDARVTIDNWTDTTDSIRWTHLNTPAVFKTAPVLRGNSPVWVLPRKPLDPDRLSRALVKWGRSHDNAAQISVSDWLARSETDALVVLHDGHIVAEQYFGEMTPATRHILWSASKSILASILAPRLASGEIQAEEQAARYVPELAKTGFAGATVRQLLDMHTGIRCQCFPSARELGIGDKPYPAEWILGTPEFRLADNDFARLTRAMGTSPKRPQDGPGGCYDFVMTLDRDRDHGQYFYYTDPNPLALQWILERTTGRPYIAHLSELLSQLGTEQIGTILIDPIGTAVSTIGVALTARDFARWGQMLCDGGRLSDRRVLPGIREMMDDVRQNPGVERWTEQSNAWDACPRYTGYRGQFWTTQFRTNKPAVPVAVGLHSQRCYIDEESRTVVVKFSSLWNAAPDKLQAKHEGIFEQIACESFLDSLRHLLR